MVLNELGWNINKERTGPVSYVITDTEKSYLLKGDGGKYSNAQLTDVHERIRNKGTKLPNRFQDLIDDLILFSIIDLPTDSDTSAGGGGSFDIRDPVQEQILKEGVQSKAKLAVSNKNSGEKQRKNTNENITLKKEDRQVVEDFLERGDYDNLIERLLNIDNRASQLQDVSNDYILDPATEFGIEFGSALKTFLDSCDSSAAYEEIIFGMLIAGMDASGSNEESSQERLRRTLDRFESQYDLRREMLKLSDEQSQKRNEQKKEKQIEIKQSLLACGIDPTDDLTEVIRSEMGLRNETIEFVQRYEEVWKVTRKIVEIINEDSSYVSKNISGVSGRDLVLFLFFCYNKKHKTGKNISGNIQFDDMSADALSQNYTYPVNIDSFSSYLNVTRQNITKALSILSDNHNYNHINNKNPHYGITKEVNGKWKLTGYGRAVALNLLFEKTRYIHRYACSRKDVRGYNEYFAAEDTFYEIMSQNLPQYDNKIEVRNNFLSNTFCIRSSANREIFEQLISSMD